MRLTWLALMAPLAACAAAPSEAPPAPAVAVYTTEFQQELANEIEGCQPNGFIIRAMDDYAVLRAEVRVLGAEE